jgi:hypothetical protein
MAREISAVLEYGSPAPGETAAMMEDKLRCASIPIHGICALISGPDFPTSS